MFHKKIGLIPFFLSTVKVLLKLEKGLFFSAFYIYFDVSNMTKQNKY